VETIRYGDHPEQVVEVRLPEGPGPHPVALVVHGGFWRAAFTRANTAAIATDLARRGWATWNVEYRRVGTGGGVPETLEDIEAAVEAARPELVIGHSAGGQLALWAAGTGKVARAVSLAGVTDLARAAREGIGDGAAVEFAGADPPAHADPMRRLPIGTPQLLVHGDQDDRVPVDYSRAYAAAAPDEVELLELAGVGHFELIDPRTDAWAHVLERL
jgi:acetyl esterase/lipase